MQGASLYEKSGAPGVVEVWGQFIWNEKNLENEGGGESDGNGHSAEKTASNDTVLPEKGGDVAEGESLMTDTTPKKSPFSLSLFDGSEGLTGTPLVIKPGQLVAVVGQVGSGKTSFLSSILGEMTALGPPLAHRRPSHET